MKTLALTQMRDPRARQVLLLLAELARQERRRNGFPWWSLAFDNAAKAARRDEGEK